MKQIFKTITIAVLAISLTNCKKDNTTPEPTPVAPPVATIATGNLKIRFEAMVDTNVLALGSQMYTNQAGNTFNVTTYQYYISNIKLTKSDGSVWIETNSYHLIDYSDDATTLLNLANVPFGNYTAIAFTIGVDSLRNVSGAQTGDLDPSKGMFWSWNSGYIMAKFEGTSPQSTANAQKLTFHIGGFSGTNNVIKTIAPSFNNDTAKVTASVSPEIHIANNLLEWFDTPTAIDFSVTNTVHMPGSVAKSIANNYADMFMVEHIHNF